MSGDPVASRQDTAVPAPLRRGGEGTLPCGGKLVGLTRRFSRSFGDPNAQPPTPKQTPTSEILPSPVFETPKTDHAHFDDAGGWTPRFAEDYSVFNATPGNLRGSQGPFVDFVPPFSPFAPFAPSAGQKRPLSAEGLAAEIATHATHFSPNPNVPLPPVDPARRLPSVSGSLVASQGRHGEPEIPGSAQERSAKRARRSVTQDAPGQTATPPQSARRGERKLAPKLTTDAMHNEQHGFGQQQDFPGTPQQPNMVTFVTTPTDMFGYPMSAPATAPAFGDSRFWEADASMGGMNIDFSAAGPDVFQTPTPAHRPMGSLDWSRNNQMFQDAGALPLQNPEGLPHAPQERPLAPKPMMTSLETASADPSAFAGNYPTPIDDPFGITVPGGGVNPGLLFSRPPSSHVEATSMAHSQQPPSSSAPAAPQTAQVGRGHAAPARSARPELRRSLSVKDLGPSRHGERVLASSPIKSSHRPGLSRSFSESRGKRPVGRPSLPVLAPAMKPAPPVPGNPGVSAGRSASQAGRPSGRSSPSKAHKRLSSLTSIPEADRPRSRTSVKFTIDANGRARVETTVDAQDEAPPPPSLRRRRRKDEPLRKAPWDSSEDDESSTDDEPIVIPSRTTSFALPDPLKVVPGSRAPLHTSRRSVSDRSTTSTFGTLAPGEASQNDAESDAETVMDDMLPKGASGDAASALEKLRQSRQRQATAKQAPGTGHRPRFASAAAGGGGGGGFGGPAAYPENMTISPTTLTDTSLPTPSTASRGSGGSGGGGVRCVCNRPEPRDGDGFMVQW